MVTSMEEEGREETGSQGLFKTILSKSRSEARRVGTGIRLTRGNFGLGRDTSQSRLVRRRSDGRRVWQRFVCALYPLGRVWASPVMARGPQRRNSVLSFPAIFSSHSFVGFSLILRGRTSCARQLVSNYGATVPGASALAFIGYDRGRIHCGAHSSQSMEGVRNRSLLS